MSDSVVLTCDSLIMTFQKRGDRYGHQISRYFSDGIVGLLVSHEGTSDDVWPPSPVLQSLHLERRPGGVQTALLVGTAGRSHWSLSVEADATRNRLLFDVACRIHDAPEWLGSSYDGFNQHGKACPLECLKLTAWPGDSKEIEIAVQIDRLHGTVKIPAPKHLTNGPQTIRWRYIIAVANPP
jgi:hypothetical protein